MKLCNFKILKKWFQKTVPSNLTELQKVYLFRILTKKIAFPYDYIILLYYISDDKYYYAMEIWKYFNIKNLKEFNMLYNIIDVIVPYSFETMQ